MKNSIEVMSLLRTPLVSGFVALTGSVLIASAANNPPSPVNNVQGIQDVLCVFISYFFWIVITVSVIFVVVAAYHYVTAGDDTEKTAKARKYLTYGAVGIAVALCALGFPQVVGSLFPAFNNPLIPQCTLFGA